MNDELCAPAQHSECFPALHASAKTFNAQEVQTGPFTLKPSPGSQAAFSATASSPIGDATFDASVPFCAFVQRLRELLSICG